jgi:nucleotide-binding universal stress UspA family protein
VKILIATDGSEFSEGAIDACCQLVTLGAASEILVVSVYEAQIPMPAEPFAISAEYYQKLDDLAHARAVEAVEAAAERIRSCEREATVTTKVELGRPAQVIVECAAEWGPDLVIVGSHGRGFWGRLSLGSVSDAVVHHAPCSVLVVRGAKK